MAGRNLKVMSMLSLTALWLSGCGWVQQDPYQSSYTGGQAAHEQALAPPKARVMQTADATWLVTDQTAKPVPTAAELAELKQANTRIAELEDEIAALRNDMTMMMPALTRLAGGQGSMSVEAEPLQTAGVAGNLNQIMPAAGGSVAAGEMERIHQAYRDTSAYDQDPEAAADHDAALTAAPTPPVPTPVPTPPLARAVVPPAVAPAYQPPPAATPVTPPAPVKASYTPPVLDVTAIQNVRFGQHDNGKSRLVIDVSAARDFRYDIDNNERILVLEIPGTVWNAGPVTKNILDHPLVQAMTASPDGQGGTRVVFQLLNSAQVLWSQAIPPSGSQGHRIVIDVASN
ncbi:MAG: AMIN domain-containing protein [Alphaproteobacteria bacterium]|nr:AMIN domain-containing protein [Alphaproteobacteria bacterium]